MKSSTGSSLPLIEPPKEDYTEKKYKAQHLNSVSFHFCVQIFSFWLLIGLIISESPCGNYLRLETL